MKSERAPEIREARPEDAAAIARVQVASWRSTYPGIVPDGFLARMRQDDFALRWRRWLEGAPKGRVFFVAESPGEGVVGFATGGPGREPPRAGYDGELYTAYLLNEHQGRGLGRALFGAVAEGLFENGCRSMFAWVMEKNAPARRFYEALGGEVLGENTFEVEGVAVGEVAYGWEDIRVLAGLR